MDHLKVKKKESSIKIVVHMMRFGSKSREMKLGKPLGRSAGGRMGQQREGAVDADQITFGSSGKMLSTRRL